MMIHVWLFLNSMALLILGIIQYLSIRQIGIMLTRLGPVGARSADGEGPRDGEHIDVQIQSLYRENVKYLGNVQTSTTNRLGALYLFGSYRCSICKDMRRSAAELSRHWSKQIQIFMVYDEEQPPSANESHVVNSQRDFQLVVLHNGIAVRESLNIEGVPYGIRVDRSNRVLGKGLVNSISHIESLLELEADTGLQDDSRPVDQTEYELIHNV